MGIPAKSPRLHDALSTFSIPAEAEKERRQPYRTSASSMIDRIASF